MSQFFPNIGKIAYEGPKSKNALSYKHYNPDEVVEMARVVKRYGGYYGVHVGSEGFDMMEELAKTLRVARDLGLLPGCEPAVDVGERLVGAGGEPVDFVVDGDRAGIARQRFEFGDLAFEVGDRLFEIEIGLHARLLSW